jgi:hypothetical protein
LQIKDKTRDFVEAGRRRSMDKKGEQLYDEKLTLLQDVYSRTGLGRAREACLSCPKIRKTSHNH